MLSSRLSKTLSMASSSSSDTRNIVVIGGGIIGCTTAYLLTRHPSFNPQKHTITILEASSIAAGASGKAGGLLALWAYPSSIVPLSYKLHAELAKEHGGDKRWGYRTLHCGSLSAKGKIHEENPGVVEGLVGKEQGKKIPKVGEGKVKYGKKGVPEDLDWFEEEGILGYSEMGTPDTTAQVHPYQFTTSMADLAVEAGAKVILGMVKSIDYKGSDGVKSVTYEDRSTKESHTIPATDVVLSAGPWTGRVFPPAPIGASRAHSIVIEADVSPYAIFSEIELPKSAVKAERRRQVMSASPEMYARPDGTVYACGTTDGLALPKTADDVQVDSSRCQEIMDHVSSISGTLRRGKILAEQACYLPSIIGADGPLIGETGIRGLFMATGHTCWGIQNSCATGKLISEFVFDGEAKSAKIRALDPRQVL